MAILVRLPFETTLSYPIFGKISFHFMKKKMKMLRYFKFRRIIITFSKKKKKRKKTSHQRKSRLERKITLTDDDSTRSFFLFCFVLTLKNDKEDIFSCSFLFLLFTFIYENKSYLNCNWIKSYVYIYIYNEMNEKKKSNFIITIFFSKNLKHYIKIKRNWF